LQRWFWAVIGKKFFEGQTTVVNSLLQLCVIAIALDI